MNLFTMPTGPGRIACRWCRKNRGLLVIGPPGHLHGILLCPRCDWAHDHAAGPPPAVEHRIRDVDPKP